MKGYHLIVFLIAQTQVVVVSTLNLCSDETIVGVECVCLSVCLSATMVIIVRGLVVIVLKWLDNERPSIQ